MPAIFRTTPQRLAAGAIVACGLVCVGVREHYLFQLPYRYYIWCWWPLIAAWDVAQTLILLILFWGIARLFRNRPRALRSWGFLIIGLCWIIAVYNVLAIPAVFEYRSPPTLGFIRFIGLGNLWNLASKGLLIATAGLFLPAAWILAWVWRIPLSSLKKRWIAGFLLLAMAVYICVGWKELKRMEANIGLSANCAGSLLTTAFKGNLPQAASSIEFPPVQKDYFEVPPAPPKNLILIVLESVETKFLSLYGSPYPTTPNLERMRNQSLALDNFYSPVTNSSNSLHAMLFGSDYPGVWKDFTLAGWKPRAMSLPEHLKKLGYATSFATSCDFSYADLDQFVKSHGFDRYIDFVTEKIDANAKWGVDDHYLIDFILQSVDSTPAGSPFFVMGWNQGTHWNFTPAPEHQPIDFLNGDKKFGGSAFDFNNYLNAIHFIDQQIERLMDELEKRKIADDTLVAIVGDHGEAFGWPHKTWGHSAHVYEEDVHVPFVLINARAFSPGHRVATPAMMADLSPTILDLMNIAPPADWKGVSALKAGHPATAFFHGANESLQFGVRREQWKYIYDPSLMAESLYDLAADPDEQRDRANENPDLCANLRTLILRRLGK